MPELGNDVAKLSRRAFFPLAVLALAITMSDFYWSAYPFDNVCREYYSTSLITYVILFRTHSSRSIPDADETISNGAFEEYAGSHRIETASNTSMEVIINEGSKVYRFCDQDFLWNGFQLCLISSTRTRENGCRKTKFGSHIPFSLCVGCLSSSCPISHTKV
jgi:hypothetical protein